MEEKVNNRYFLGVIGALIGALVGAIPWVLLYVFADLMYSLLAIIIVICSFYGYKLTKAKIDKKLPIILSVASFVAITITMFLIIPVCYLANELGQVTWEMLQAMYSSSDFLGALMTDYLISLLFGAVVIGIIIYNLNKQLKSGVEGKDIKILSRDISNEQFSSEDIAKVRDIFRKNNATNKKQTITKELVMEDMVKVFGEEKAKRIFDYLKIQEIIKKKANKYYFEEKAEGSIWYRYGIANLRTFLIVLAIAVVLAFAIVYFEQNTAQDEANQLLQEIASNESGGEYELGAGSLKLVLPDDMVRLTDEQIVRGFGEGYDEAYELFATSTDFQKLIMVFNDSKSNYEEDYTPEEYLKTALQDDTLEIKKLEVSDQTFYYVERPYSTEDGIEGMVIDGVLDGGDKFVCMILDIPKDSQFNLEEIIK